MAGPGGAAKTKKSALRALLQEAGWSWIGAAEFEAVRQRLAPVSESYLQRLLRETGLPVVQPYAGVDQTDFDALERSLLAMLGAYRGGDRELQRRCRAVVIEAKMHARMAARRSEDKRSIKEEMAQWLLVWLESPEVFPAWAKRRRELLGC